MDQTKIRETLGKDQTAISPVRGSNIINYENAHKRRIIKEERMFNLFGSNKEELTRFNESIRDCFEIIKNKEDLEYHTEIIKECFEISCYILYDRQILEEVISKQKEFGIDYVADFLRYILRVFVRRFNESPILTKNQCSDIKTLCKCILKINNSSEKHTSVINKSSAKEIVEYLKTIIV